MVKISLLLRTAILYSKLLHNLFPRVRFPGIWVPGYWNPGKFIPGNCLLQKCTAKLTSELAVHHSVLKMDSEFVSRNLGSRKLLSEKNYKNLFPGKL